MKKENQKGIVLVILLLLVAVTGTFVVTYSKYVSTGSGSATAKIAKWEIKVGETLLENIDLSSITWTGLTNNMIAPGSTGTYNVSIKNNSDVDANISAALGSAGITGMSTTNNNITVSVSGGTSTTIAAGATKNVTLTITWSNTNSPAQDTADTATGKTDGGKTITIPIEITAVQNI